MKLIPVHSKGSVVYAKVDDEDFDSLSGRRWVLNNGGYAVRSNGQGGTNLMHREILQAPKKMLVDHVNREPLDNQRSNLRLATFSLNSYNRRDGKNNTSGHRAVGYEKKRETWRVWVPKQGGRSALGSYPTIEKAVEAYHEYMMTKHGKLYCCL